MPDTDEEVPVTEDRARRFASKLLDKISEVSIEAKPILLYKASLTIPAVLTDDGGVYSEVPVDVYHRDGGYEWLTFEDSFGMCRGSALEIEAIPALLETAKRANTERRRIEDYPDSDAPDGWPQEAIDLWPWLRRVYVTVLSGDLSRECRWKSKTAFEEDLKRIGWKYIPLIPEAVILFGGLRRQMAEGYARLYQFLRRAEEADGGLHKFLQTAGIKALPNLADSGKE